MPYWVSVRGHPKSLIYMSCGSAFLPEDPLIYFPCPSRPPHLNTHKLAILVLVGSMPQIQLGYFLCPPHHHVPVGFPPRAQLGHCDFSCPDLLSHLNTRMLTTLALAYLLLHVHLVSPLILLHLSWKMYHKPHLILLHLSWLMYHKPHLILLHLSWLMYHKPHLILLHLSWLMHLKPHLILLH